MLDDRMLSQVVHKVQMGYTTEQALFKVLPSLSMKDVEAYVHEGIRLGLLTYARDRLQWTGMKIDLAKQGVIERVGTPFLSSLVGTKPPAVPTKKLTTRETDFSEKYPTRPVAKSAVVLPKQATKRSSSKTAGVKVKVPTFLPKTRSKTAIQITREVPALLPVDSTTELQLGLRSRAVIVSILERFYQSGADMIHPNDVYNELVKTGYCNTNLLTRVKNTLRNLTVRNLDQPPLLRRVLKSRKCEWLLWTQEFDSTSSKYKAGISANRSIASKTEALNEWAYEQQGTFSLTEAAKALHSHEAYASLKRSSLNTTLLAAVSNSLSKIVKLQTGIYTHIEWKKQSEAKLKELVAGRVLRSIEDKLRKAKENLRLISLSLVDYINDNPSVQELANKWCLDIARKEVKHGSTAP